MARSAALALRFLGAAFLEEHRHQLEERLDEYTESERILAEAVHSRTLPDEVEDLIRVDAEAGLAPDRGQEALMFYLTLRQGILVLQARLVWCHEAAAALQSNPPELGAIPR